LGGTPGWWGKTKNGRKRLELQRLGIKFRGKKDWDRGGLNETTYEGKKKKNH